MEKGDAAHAIPLLEQAVQQLGQFRYRQMQSNFARYLGEAYLLDRQIEKARDLTLQGLAIARDIQNWMTIGRAQRLLGRIAQASGTLTEAESHLQEALQTLTSIQARFELARTHLDLASLAHAQGNQDTATTHLNQAYAWFTKLQVPKYVERAEQLAREHDITLTEVPLETLTED